MCGIFGVRGVPDATSCVHLGLYSLQHRGQESSGVVTVDERGTARALRAMGLVSEGIDGHARELPGETSIGHTRYSTAGSSTIDNAQPILAHTLATWRQEPLLFPFQALRAFVNRLWAMFFGEGLSNVLDDLGGDTNSQAVLLEQVR
jgi:hypothetical protein